MFAFADSDLPLVSIIIPVYNGSDWMAVAIDSALAQTYPKVEVIVVNDGSTDGGKTAAIAESYGKRIRYIAQTNGGVGSALNTGIATMRGAYFSWLSHDDVYLPEKIATQMHAISKFDEDVVIFGNVRLIDNHSDTIEDIYFSARFSEEDEPFWYVLAILLSGCSMLIPRVCFDTCGLFNPALPTTQDYDLWFRIAARYRFVCTPDIHTLSRQHADQGSRAIGHLDEVTLMFLRFISELPNVTRHRAPGELLAIAQRARTLPSAGISMAIRLRLERWQSELRAQVRPLLVVPAADARGALTAQAHLEAVGYGRAELVFVRDTLEAGPALAPEAAAAHELLLHRQGLSLLVTEDTPDREVAAAVAALARPDQLILFWDAERMNDPAALLQHLDDVLTGRAEAILSARDTTDRPLDGLIARGSVLQQAAGGDAGDWHEWLDRLAPRQPTGRDALATDLPGASLAEPGPASKKRRRVRLPRLLRPSTWTMQKNRARIAALRDLFQRRGRKETPPLPQDVAALAPMPIPPAPVTTPVDSELLILVTPAVEARDWARHLDRTLRSGVRRMFGHLEMSGRLSLATSNPKEATSFTLSDDLESAAEYLRSCGIRRVSIIGTTMPEPAYVLLQALAVPYEVTPLSPPDDGRIEEVALLEGAQRVIAPTFALAKSLPAVARDRVLTMAAPGVREACSFYVAAPVVKPGEPLRVLVLSLLRHDSEDRELRGVAALLASERADVELFAAGERGTGGSLAGVNWLGGYDDRRLINYIGTVAPHLIWVILDPAAHVAPALLDVMWAGLPLLVTGPEDAVDPVRGRALSCILPSAKAERVAQRIRACRDGVVGFAPAETSHFPPFDLRSFLHWRD